jgi:hypothetical protein
MPLFHEEVGCPQQVILRNKEELQTLCLSEKGRYVVLLGRIKENTFNLRQVHSVIDVEWNEVMAPDSGYFFALSGDLKYMSTMLGHGGAGCTHPCTCCGRTRELLGYRSWVPAELAYIQSKQPKTFTHSPDQLRSYPDNPECSHDVLNKTCLCVSQGAKYIKDKIEATYPEESKVYACCDTKAPFHAAATKLSREHAYSIVDQPLLPMISSDVRMPGIWHCTHNCRVMLWLMCKDISCQCGVIPGLQSAMNSIGLGQIRVSADKKPRKEANIEGQVSAENAAVNALTAKEDAERNTKSSMQGTELEKVFDNFARIVDHLEDNAQDDESKLKLRRWRAPVERALHAFNEGCKVALADIWTHNRADELGHFRTFVDELMSIPTSAGLPYQVREYISILPVHYLAEPSHLQAKASAMYEQFGVAPGSGTDAATEMVYITGIPWSMRLTC